MSYSDKQDGTSKDEWVAKLEEGSHIQRVFMNNLIMNYLVQGKKIADFLFLTIQDFNQIKITS